MTGSINIYLPLSTYVNVLGFTNAAFQQRATLTQQNGVVTVMTGTGEHNSPMQNGSLGIQTPASSPNPEGYLVTVAIDSFQNGSWVPSDVTSGKTSLVYYNLALVVSEDLTDEDWNDTVVQFSWWTAPSGRNLLKKK